MSGVSRVSEVARVITFDNVPRDNNLWPKESPAMERVGISRESSEFRSVHSVDISDGSPCCGCANYRTTTRERQVVGTSRHNA